MRIDDKAGLAGVGRTAGEGGRRKAWERRLLLTLRFRIMAALRPTSGSISSSIDVIDGGTGEVLAPRAREVVGGLSQRLE